MVSRRKVKSFVLYIFFGVGVPAADGAGPYSGHGVESVKPEELVQYAPQAVDGALMAKIQSYMDLRSPGGGAVTSDGKKMFFNWSVTGVNQVWRIDGPNQFPVQMTGGKDATGIAGISRDGKWIFLHRDRNGEENPGLYMQPALGGALVVIQHKPKIRTTLQEVSQDGKHIYYRANDVKPDAYAIYRYNLAERRAEKIFDQEGLWNLIDEAVDGKLLLRKATGSLTSEWYEYHPKTGALSTILGEGELTEYELSYTAVPGQFLVETNKFGEFRQIYVFEFKSKKFTRIGLNIEADVTGATIDPTRSRVVYGVNDRGYEKIYGLDAKTWKPLRLPSLPKADLTFSGAWSQNGRYLVVGTYGAKQQFKSHVIDWSQGKTVSWNAASSPEIDVESFADVTLESYKARDGVDIPMFVRRPEKCRKASCPVIVSFHGGPEGQSQPGLSTRSQLFVEAGFVFVEPNVRGSSGYGKTWISADDGPKRLAVITDIEDCALHIKKSWAHGGPAPKVGVTGGSYGGYAVMMAMSRFAGAYDVGVSIVGISNLLTFLNNTAPYRRALRISEYGDPIKDKDALVELSPSTHVDKIKGPLLIIQGATDPRVPVGEAIQMHAAMKKKNIPSELIVFADEGHGSQKRDNRALEIAHTLQFFQKHLAVTSAP